MISKETAISLYNQARNIHITTIVTIVVVFVVIILLLYFSNKSNKLRKKILCISSIIFVSIIAVISAKHSYNARNKLTKEFWQAMGDTYNASPCQFDLDLINLPVCVFEHNDMQTICYIGGQEYRINVEFPEKEKIVVTAYIEHDLQIKE